MAWGLITPNVPKFVVRGAGTDGGPAASTASTGTAAQTSQAQSNQAQAASAAGWPPSIAPGQTYQITIQRSAGTPKSESWTLALSSKAANGEASGQASQGSRRQKGYVSYDQKQDLIWIDLTADDQAMTSCAFDAVSLKTTPWVGRAYSFADPKAEGVRIGDCRAVLGSAPAPAQAAATSAGSNLTWPVKPQLGQTWVMDIEKLGRWTVTLKQNSSKGNPLGASISDKGDTWDAAMYYDAKSDVVWYDMTQDGKSSYSCGFGPKGVQGGKLLGTVFSYKDENDTEGTKIGNCDATLK